MHFPIVELGRSESVAATQNEQPTTGPRHCSRRGAGKHLCLCPNQVKPLKIRAGRITRVHVFYDPTTHYPRVRRYLRAPRTRPEPSGRAGALQCQPRSGQCDLVTAFFDSGGIFENARTHDNSSSRVPRPHRVFYSRQRAPESTTHSARTAWAC